MYMCIYIYMYMHTLHTWYKLFPCACFLCMLVVIVSC